MARRRKGEQRTGACAYCGKVGKITRDHVFPRILFIRADPDMITVPSCTHCQIEKQKGESFLRDLVNLELYGGTHPDALLQVEKIIRAMQRNRSHLGNQYLQAGYEQDVIVRGIYRGRTFVVPFGDKSVLDETMRYIVRGLHFHETGSRLPDGTPIEVLYIDPLKREEIIGPILNLPPTHVAIKGNSIAGWASYRAPGAEPKDVAYVIEFNSAVYFLCTTGRLAEVQRESFGAKRRERIGKS